jgi:spore germination cell wall hydrolase CwlJ-like protein
MTTQLKISIGLAMLIASSIDTPAPPTDYSTAEFKCMVDNLYHEARGEGVLGLSAVASVVMNRAMATGQDVCDVVYKHKQFSWTHNPKPIASNDNLHNIFVVAGKALSGQLTDVTQGATHYHATHVKPKWAKAMRKVVIINNHIFYKETK